jgi:D-arabinose 1-dehydrogenase-like Zn-dependent alcohol dehydrogenase
MRRDQWPLPTTRMPRGTFAGRAEANSGTHIWMRHETAVVRKFGQPLVIGSIVGTRADLADVFALPAAGRTRVSYETRPPGSVSTAIQDVRQGKAKGRLVLTP